MKYLTEYVYFLTESVDDNVWYHGSNKGKFDKFKLKKGTLLDPNYISPIFLTSGLKFAKSHSGEFKTSYIKTIKVLTDNIFDFRLLATSHDILMYEDKNIKKDGINYELSVNLYNFICDNWDNIHSTASYEDGLYDDIVGGYYGDLEQVWFYEWLKGENFDGAYVIETNELNLFIFDPNKLKIINIDPNH